MYRLYLALPLLLIAFSSQADEQQQRIDFIQQQFLDTRDHSKTRQWGWLGF